MFLRGLDWLGDLTGDDYLGSKTIDLEIIPAITTPGDTSSPEHQPLVRLHRYIVEGVGARPPPLTISC